MNFSRSAGIVGRLLCRDRYDGLNHHVVVRVVSKDDLSMDSGVPWCFSSGVPFVPVDAFIGLMMFSGSGFEVRRGPGVVNHVAANLIA